MFQVVLKALWGVIPNQYCQGSTRRYSEAGFRMIFLVRKVQTFMIPIYSTVLYDDSITSNEQYKKSLYARYKIYEFSDVEL